MVLRTSLLAAVVFLLCTNISSPRNTLLVPLSVFVLLMYHRRAWRNAGVAAHAGLVAGGALGIAFLYSIFLNGIRANETFLYQASLAFFYHLVLIALLYRDTATLRAVVNAVLVIMVASFLIQLSIFYVTGTYLDLREIFGGAASKVGDSSVLSELWGLPRGLVRATSFFNEPGTFATVLIQLLLVSFLVEGRYRPIHWLAVISLFLTFSTFGILYGVLFLGYSGVIRTVLGEGRFARRTLLLMAVLAIAVIAVTFAVDYVQGRFVDNHKNDGGLGFRVAWLDHWLHSGLFAQLQGRGIGFWDSAYALGEKIYIEDIGMWFHLTVNLGIFGLAVLWMFWHYARSWPAIGAICILLLSKNVFYSYSTLMTLALLMCAQTRSQEVRPARVASRQAATA